ncbi:MAG TPA: Ig-like domain-containing protein [Gemmatimonadales bacterium]|jgi:hypothetical protein
MKRALFGVVVALLAVGCGDEGPVSIDVKVDGLPAVTNLVLLKITGTVHRTPAKKTTYIVTLAGATKPVADTVDSAGHFAVTVPLTAETANTFTITATDEGGAVSPAVTVGINQDDQPPTVTQVTPLTGTDAVARTQTVSFVLSEAPPGGVSFSLLRQGVPQNGVLTMASDSLHGTFTPVGQLAPNSIYVASFTHLIDAAGNNGNTVRTCFVTVGASTVAPDGVDDLYQAGTPGPNISAADLVEARWARDSSRLTGVFKFTSARSIQLSDPNNVDLVVDFDIDQNAATGFKSYRDTIVASIGPSAFSGIGAEYIAGLFALSGPADSAFVAPYAGVLKISTVGLFPFIQDVCGPFVGFNVPFINLGNDDGKMNYSVIALTEDGSNAYADIMPAQGPLTFDATVSVSSPSLATVSALLSSHSGAVPRPLPRIWRLAHKR